MKPDTPSDPQLQSIQVAGNQLFFTETGAGRPVVALHGLPASSRDFRWLDSALDGRVRFFRLDLPGFGSSPALEPGPSDPSGYGAVVASFCEAANLEDVVVLGHSMGGVGAVDAAIRSDRVTALVLVNSSGPINHRGNFPRAYRVTTALGDVHPLVRRLLLRILKPVASKMGFSKRLEDDALVLAVRLCGQFVPAAHGEQMKALRVPSLVAWSPGDPSVQPEVSEGILALIPEAKSLQIDAKSHNLQATHATELAEALVAWLGETNKES